MHTDNQRQCTLKGLGIPAAADMLQSLLPAIAAKSTQPWTRQQEMNSMLSCPAVTLPEFPAHDTASNSPVQGDVSPVGDLQTDDLCLQAGPPFQRQS